MIRISIFIMIVFAIGANFAKAQVSIEEVVKRVNFEQKLNSQVPLELTFVDDHGVQAPLQKYFREGRPVVLVLGYYACPMLCTRVLNSLVGSLKLISNSPGRDYEIIMVSIDPKENSRLAADKKSSCLHEYSRPGSEDGWHFLTGNEPGIDSLCKATGFHFVYDQELKQFAHPSGIIILTPKGRIAQYFLGVDYPTRNIQSALIDASAEKTGTVAEQVLLLCFEYNATTGKFSFAVIKALRICAILVVLALGSYIVFMLRLDLRKAQHRAGKRSV